MRRPTKRRAGATPILAGLSILAVLVGAAVGSASAATAGPPPVAAPPNAVSLSAGDAEEYWTPERLADAQPLELREGADTAAARSSDPGLLRASATTLKEAIVNSPAAYPNRVHGKIFGTYPNVGDYSCSGTVVTSKSGSLVTTAGHCVYDAGAGRSNQFASQLAFIPGYSSGNTPYGVFEATNAIVPGQWIRASLDYDLAMLRLDTEAGETVQKAVGSRGIGFSQKRKQRLSAYGYPSRGRPAYNGERLAKCTAGYVPDPVRYGGPRSRGMRCDQKQGSSGGGWVSQQSFVVSNTSHDYTRAGTGSTAPTTGRSPSPVPGQRRGLDLDRPDPLPRPGGLDRRTSRSETIRGSKGKDVIATLGGNDRILGGGKRDLICGGTGSDRILGGGGDDRIDGGAGGDRCDGANGRDRFQGCEVRRQA